MYNNNIFIDFDGVIYDTEKRVVERKKHCDNLSWENFFERLNWFELLEESQIINDSIPIILDVQERRSDIAILTKIHTLLEAQAKIATLRKNKIEIPIYIVPPHIKKSEIYVPKNGEILIDDSIKNLTDWKLNGGTGIYFNENLNKSAEFETVKTLKKLI